MWKLERTVGSWESKEVFFPPWFWEQRHIKKLRFVLAEDGRGIQKDFKKEFWWFCVPFRCLINASERFLYSFQITSVLLRGFQAGKYKRTRYTTGGPQLNQESEDTSLRLRCQNAYLKMSVQQKAEVSGEND